MKRITQLLLLTLFLGLTTQCTKDDNTDADMSAVKENYAAMALANYTDAHTAAQTLQTAITAFVSNPSATTMATAKQAWLDAREPYGQSEAFRFSGGPIDEYGEAPEGNLNAWPLDESYIDYVEGNATSGIINDTTQTISKDNLASLNEEGGETNISIGYHAIEFLLWGQDVTSPSAETAGQRSYLDFAAGQGNGNEVRRGEYLAVASELIIDQLAYLIGEWETSGSYYKAFMAEDHAETVKNLFQSIAIFSKGELAGERIIVAYTNQDQEDEHSCFSDNTHRDVILNQKGIGSIFMGTYGTVSGKSLYDLIKAENETLAEETKLLVTQSATEATSLYTPFDVAISNPTYRPDVLNLGNSLKSLGDKIVECGTTLGFTISADLPE